MHGLATKHLDKTETITRQNILNLETVFLHVRVAVRICKLFNIPDD